MSQNRGQLTDRTIAKSKELLGYEIEVNELRLMAYVDYIMKNEQRLDPGKVSKGEREILGKWRLVGYIEGGASGMSITKQFYDILCEILWLGYVDLS